ncbi:hypothetical protein J6Q66_07320 [bacterium]|nr:hypothetical protein [bacterium]
MDFNSNLNKLFQNYEKQLDVKNDKTLKKEAKALLKDKNLFDVNGDGQFTQADVDMLLKADFNGDGVQSADELNFISTYKDDMQKAFKKAKADFEMDGVKYQEGKPVTGLVDNVYYKSGKLGTGSYKGLYYTNGVPANGVIKKVLYQEGVKFTGVNESDGLYYKNGNVASGKVTDGNTTANYKKGVLQYSTTDNNGKDYPKVSGQNIQCKNGSKKVTIKLNVGDVAVINADGTIDITGKDGKVKQYSSDGNLLANAVKKDLGGLLTNYQNKTEKKDVTGDGKYDNSDKNIVNANDATILKESMLFDIDGDKKLTQADIDKFLEGDIDGDGKTSDLEKAFVKEYKNDLKTAFTKAKADFNLDNKQYFDGAIAKGVEKDGLHYTNGAKTNGDVNNQLYIDGAKSNLTGEYEGNGKYYVNGIAANGLQENGFHYTNGNKTNGVATENGEKYFYKDGVKGAGQAAGDEKNQVFVYDEDGKYHHSVKGFWIKANGDYKRTYVENPSDRCSEPNKLFFKGSDQETHFIKIEKGDEIRIFEDGMFSIARGDTKYKYNEVGELINLYQIINGQYVEIDINAQNISALKPPYIDGVPPANSSGSTGSTGGTTGTGGTTPSIPSGSFGSGAVDNEGNFSYEIPETLKANFDKFANVFEDLNANPAVMVGFAGSNVSDVDLSEYKDVQKDSLGRVIKMTSKETGAVYSYSYSSNSASGKLTAIRVEYPNDAGVNSVAKEVMYFNSGKLDEKGNPVATNVTKLNAEGSTLYDATRSWDKNGVETRDVSTYQREAKDREAIYLNAKYVDGELKQDTERLTSYNDILEKDVISKKQETKVTDYNGDEKDVELRSSTTKLNSWGYDSRGLWLATTRADIVNATDGSINIENMSLNGVIASYSSTSEYNYNWDTPVNIGQTWTSWDENGIPEYYKSLGRPDIGGSRPTSYDINNAGLAPDFLTWGGLTAWQLENI